MPPRKSPSAKYLAKRPIFVCLHGAWHSPKVWKDVAAELSMYGFSVVRPDLPSSGSDPPTSGFFEDIATIRQTVTELVKEHDVVVVMHSFSGMTGGSALSGLDKKSCLSKGMKGGVVKLVYIMAFLVPEGFQHSPEGTRDNMVPEMHTDMAAGTVTVDQGDAKAMFYQDMGDDEVSKLSQDLRPHSLSAFWSSTTSAAWRYIPTTYVLCTEDKPSTVVAARHLVDSAKASQPNMIDNVMEVETGHSPFLSQPKWTAMMLIKEADSKVIG